MRVSVVGLGKLGLPLTTFYASKGHWLLGIDTNRQLVDALTRGNCPIDETDLKELLRRNYKNIRFSTDFYEVDGTDITFVLVPTPSNRDGSFSNTFVETALHEVVCHLKNKQSYHLIVVVSTVIPGSMSAFKSQIELESSKKVGSDIGLCYSPEFVALGNVLQGLAAPDVVLIGESDIEAGSVLESFYRSVLVNTPLICRMSFENAELAKIALNTFVTTKISFANTLAELCERIKGGNVDVITSFLGEDKRIGPKYLKGGLSFGGPCFPRDQRAFGNFGCSLGVTCSIQRATDVSNDSHTSNIFCSILEFVKCYQPATVSILGVTYKPDTSVVDESQILEIVRRLEQEECVVKLYDPQGIENARRVLPISEHIHYTRSVLECIENSDLCVLATPWSEFKNILPITLLQNMRHPNVYDCWRLWDSEQFKSVGITYRALGVSSV